MNRYFAGLMCLVFLGMSIILIASNSFALRKNDLNYIEQLKPVRAAARTAGKTIKRINLRQHLNKSKQLQTNPQVKAAGVISAAAVTLDANNELTRLRPDEQWQHKSYSRYRQTYKGIPIWGEQVIMVQGGGRFKARGTMIEGLTQALPDVTPAISSTQALTLVKAQVQGLINKKLGTTDALSYHNEKAKLVIYCDEADYPHLAYVVSFFAVTKSHPSPTRPFTIINAKTGAILSQWENLMTEKIGTGPGGNEKTGQYEYGNDRDHLDIKIIDVTSTLATDQVKTFNVDHDYSFDTSKPGYSFLGTRNTFQFINGAYAPLNDAHYFGTKIYEMYQTWFNTTPVEGKLYLGVHLLIDYENAYWDGKKLNFGDGHKQFYPLISLDVVAHEASHGFTQRYSDLWYSGQSGGINESFSDMAGEAAKYYVFGQTDFLVGADIVKSGQALRYMADPPRDGQSIDHVAEYHDAMNVHYSSGIYNKVFYLISTSPGWDVKKAFDIFLRANQYYWTEYTDFREGALGVLEATADLGYSTPAVVQAFSQAGIYLADSYLGLLQPNGRQDYAYGSYDIKWADEDPKADAAISLYYDNDNQGQDGTLIVSGLSENDENDHYLWDVSTVPPGQYYIYVVMDNQIDAPRVSYSTGPVTVVSADAYESDNDAGQASVISLNGSQSNHNLVPAGDVDWIKFTVDQLPIKITAKISTLQMGGKIMAQLYDAELNDALIETGQYTDYKNVNLVATFDQGGTII